MALTWTARIGDLRDWVGAEAECIEDCLSEFLDNPDWMLEFGRQLRFVRALDGRDADEMVEVKERLFRKADIDEMLEDNEEFEREINGE